jgi:hypothetical protein
LLSRLSAKVPIRVDLPRPGSAVKRAGVRDSTAKVSRLSASAKLLWRKRPLWGTSRLKGIVVKPK